MLPKIKLYFVFIFSILAISCKIEMAKEQFLLPDRTEIVKIIEAINSEKNIPVKIDSLQRFHMPLASDLYKLHIFIPEENETKKKLILSLDKISITELLNIKVKNKHFFSQKDSAFFIYQNDTLKNIDLHKELGSNFHLTTSKEQDTIDKNTREPYWKMSVPIFSKDLNKAYIVVNEICYGLCGSVSYVLLEKTNNQWTIIDYKMLWIS